MKHTKLLFFSILIVLFSSCKPENEYILTSKNGETLFKLSVVNDTLFYSVENNKSRLIEPSSLILHIDSTKLGTSVKSIKLLEETKSNNSSEESKSYKFEILSHTANPFTLNVNIYNSGVAFRFNYKTNTRLEATDCSTFNLPTGLTLWGQDKYKHYEGAYRKLKTGEFEAGRIFGPPVTVQYNDSTYLLITEASVTNYAGTYLVAATPNRLESRTDGISIFDKPFSSSWRVIMIGDLNSLVNNTIIKDLSPSPDKKLYADADEWIKPGRCVWSWLANYPVTFDNMKLFTNFGSTLGFEYNLVDEGWSYWNDNGKTAWELVAELSKYGKSKGVETLLWKAYPDRKGIEGIQTEERMRKFFEKCRNAGIAGVKIDFFDSENQETMRYLAQAIAIAAEYKLIVNFHGCPKPTGLNYTYPNELSREGIMGLEFGRSYSDQNTVTPFTRLIAGHGDYTPVTFDQSYMGETTAAHQLATAIILSSPLICYGGSPADYLQIKELEFFKNIPSTWNQTKVLPSSEIGECVVFARRNGNKWYLAGISKEKRDIKVNLCFLNENSNYKMTLISDNPENQYENLVKTEYVKKNTPIEVVLSKAGGFVASFEKVDAD